MKTNLMRGPRVLPAGKDIRNNLQKAFRFGEEIRRYYLSLEGEKELLHYSFFSPVISIFGERGIGKTSFLYTLLDSWKKKYPLDIVLPPIDPHKFKRHDKILEMILVFLEREIKKLNDEFGKIIVPNRLRKSCHFEESKKDSNCLYWCYQKALEGAHAAYKSDLSAGTDQVLYSYNFKLKTEFPLRFGELVRCLTEAKKEKLYYFKRNEGEETYLPLLVVPIDDIDLVPEYLEDVSYAVRLLAGNIHRLLLVITANFKVSKINMFSYYSSILLGKMPELFEKIPWKGGLSFFKEEEVVISELSNLVYQFHLKFFPLDGRVFLKAPTTDEVLNYSPSASNGKGVKKESFKNLLSKIELPYGINNAKAGISIFNLLEFSPYNLFMELLPKSWREIEELYYALKAEKNTSIPPVLKFFIKNKISTSRTLVSLVEDHIDIDYGDNIFVDLKGSIEKLIENLKIRIIFEPSITEEDKKVFIPRRISVLSPALNLSDLSLLVLLAELYVSSNSEVVLSHQLLKEIYSLLPPPLVIKYKDKALLFTVASKKFLENLKSVEKKKVSYPFSFFYYYFSKSKQKLLSEKEPLHGNIKDLKGILKSVERNLQTWDSSRLKLPFNAEFDVGEEILRSPGVRMIIDRKLDGKKEIKKERSDKDALSQIETTIGVIELDWEEFKKSILDMDLHIKVRSRLMGKNG